MIIATGKTNIMEGNDDRGKKLASGVEVIATDSTDNLNNYFTVLVCFIQSGFS